MKKIFLTAFFAIFFFEIIYVQCIKNLSKDEIFIISQFALVVLLAAGYSQFQKHKLAGYTNRELVFATCIVSCKTISIAIVIILSFFTLSRNNNSLDSHFLNLTWRLISYAFLWAVLFALLVGIFSARMVKMVSMRIFSESINTEIEKYYKKKSKIIFLSKSKNKIYAQFSIPFFITLAVLSLFFTLFSFSGPTEWYFYNLTWRLIIYSFSCAMFAAITEEIIWRGIVMGGLIRILPTSINISTAIVLSGFGFIFMHKNKSTGFYVTIVFSTLLFSILAIKTKTLWASIGVHSAWDFVQQIANGFHQKGVENQRGIVDFENGHEVLHQGSLSFLVICALIYVMRDHFKFTQRNVNPI